MDGYGWIVDGCWGDVNRKPLTITLISAHIFLPYSSDLVNFQFPPFLYSICSINKSLQSLRPVVQPYYYHYFAIAGNRITVKPFKSQWVFCLTLAHDSLAGLKCRSSYSRATLRMRLITFTEHIPLIYDS